MATGRGNSRLGADLYRLAGGMASTSATLTALIPVVQRAATEYPGCSWCGSIPGQLAVLGMPQLRVITTRLLQLSGTGCEDPGVVEILTALYLLVGLRDQLEIPYAPARRIAERPTPDPELVIASHNWTTPKPDNNWELLKVAVRGPEECRVPAADAWADAWNWRYGVLLGLDLQPTGPYLTKSRNFHFGHCGRAIAWTRRLGKVHWFEPEVSPSILLDLERGHSPLVESLVDYCREHGQLDELVELADKWLSDEAADRFATLI